MALPSSLMAITALSHLWSNPLLNNNNDNNKEEKEGGEEWEPEVTISGHFGSVEDVQWNRSGIYYISVSHDQTARIYANWKERSTSHWYEISRPQIHGYNLECVSFLPHRDHQFVSGAEEKIFRVFDAPKSFVHNLYHITGLERNGNGDEDENRPIGANIPTLGLSNKPVFSSSSIVQEEEERIEVVDEDGTSFSMVSKPADPVFITRPPYEEELIQSTLWPEIQKLYGHGNYTYCVTSNHKGNLIATAVKAKSDPAQSAIRLWDTSSWKETSLLLSHKHTVTSLSFSPDDRYLLSASRDRQFTIFQRIDHNKEGGNDGNGRVEYKCALKKAEAHGRIIWSCDWSHDSMIFATGSRDKSVTIWRLTNSGEGDGEGVDVIALSTISTKVVTALSFAPHPISSHGTDYYLLAVGFEDGLMEIWQGALLPNNSFLWLPPFPIPSLFVSLPFL